MQSAFIAFNSPFFTHQHPTSLQKNKVPIFIQTENMQNESMQKASETYNKNKARQKHEQTKVRPTTITKQDKSK